MILTKKVKIKVTKRNFDKLSETFDIKLGDILNISPNHLTNGSHVKIDVKCDICNCEKEIMYQKYIKNVNNGGFYACGTKCAQEKVKKTSIKNMVVNIIGNQKIMKKV